MGKKEKQIKRLKSRPKDFTFDEAVSLLSSLGYEKLNKGKTSGSSVSFERGNTRIYMHRPHPRNILLEYQIAEIINKLEGDGLI